MTTNEEKTGAEPACDNAEGTRPKSKRSTAARVRAARSETTRALVSTGTVSDNAESLKTNLKLNVEAVKFDPSTFGLFSRT